MNPEYAIKKWKQGIKNKPQSKKLQYDRYQKLITEYQGDETNE